MRELSVFAEPSIEDFVRLLTCIEVNPDARTLADILWLANFLSTPVAPPLRVVEPVQRLATGEAGTPKSDVRWTPSRPPIFRQKSPRPTCHH